MNISYHNAIITLRRIILNERTTVPTVIAPSGSEGKDDASGVKPNPTKAEIVAERRKSRAMKVSQIFNTLFTLFY